MIWRIWLVSFASICHYVRGNFVFSGEFPQKKQVFLWPEPSFFTSGQNTVYVCDDFQFLSVNATSIPSTLTKAFKRYRKISFPHQSKPKKQLCLSHIDLIIDNTEESHIQIDTNESYTVLIQNNQLKPSLSLHATNVYGALRGLETISQLIKFSFDDQLYHVPNCPWFIQDSPRFQHRGILVDTARHFLPTNFLEALLDSMSYAKVNVLHWHMTDGSSFPMQSKSYPKLWEGSYSAHERYLQADISNIVEYARLRGIRVMVEFDMPGHASSWCKGLPEICPAKDCLTPLNVATPKTFQVIEKLFSELTNDGKQRSGIFPDDFIHLGGDEVNLNCWEKTSHIKSWLINHNYTANDGYKYFVDKASKLAIKLGRRPVQWVEVYEQFKEKLNKKTIIHIWKEKKTMHNAIKDGYDVILSNSQYWYLDYLDTTWQSVYLNDPHEGISSQSLKKRVLGGEVAMWGETVDGSDLLSTIWPRTAAFAEKMWSPAKKTQSSQLAEARMKWFRCLLLSRGIPAAPVSNLHARSAPSQQSSCFI